MKNNLLIVLVAVVACVCLATGCNKGPKKVHVTGTITVAGETVHTGAFIFKPADGQGQDDGCRIIDGKFEADVTTGEKIIQVNSASKKTGNKIKPDPTLNPDLEVDEIEDLPGKIFTEEVRVTIEKNNQVVDIAFSGDGAKK